MYELERERDVQAAAMQATQDAMEKVRKRALDLERRNGELERSVTKRLPWPSDHGKCQLPADVQQLRSGLQETLRRCPQWHRVIHRWKRPYRCPRAKLPPRLRIAMVHRRHREAENELVSKPCRGLQAAETGGGQPRDWRHGTTSMLA